MNSHSDALFDWDFITFFPSSYASIGGSFEDSWASLRCCTSLHLWLPWCFNYHPTNLWKSFVLRIEIGNKRCRAIRVSVKTMARWKSDSLWWEFPQTKRFKVFKAADRDGEILSNWDDGGPVLVNSVQNSHWLSHLHLGGTPRSFAIYFISS